MLLTPLLGFWLCIKHSGQYGEPLNVYWDFSLQHQNSVVLVFGFFHGLGLATKFSTTNYHRMDWLPNLLAFNVSVELRQLLALGVILIAMSYWRRTSSFQRHAYTANVALLTAGFVLIGYQLTGLSHLLILDRI